MLNRLRSLAAARLFDAPRYRQALASPGGWLAICNRGERLTRAPDGTGFRCDWQWTSELYPPKLLPSLGMRLMQRALGEHPIRMAGSRMDSARPAVTFIIGHRGDARLPQLLATLSSIAGQSADIELECIVVELGAEPILPARLPSWVRHIHLRASDDQPYCRSWAFNAGARAARSDVLVFHDNDMLLPADYAWHALRLVAQQWNVLNLKRFIFYLSRADSASAAAGGELRGLTPESIVQNLQAGGSVVITREAFERIGGFNEAFLGWGGEDVEFWERAATCRVWPFGGLPVVHLWHAPQPGKNDAAAEPLRLYRRLAAITPEARVAHLRALARGMPAGPNIEHAAV